MLTYVPLAAYALLFFVASSRLYVHRPRAFTLSAVGNAKTAFHIFLALFAAARTTATAMDLTNAEKEGLKLPQLILNNVAACAYVSLLLFLEMHWRDILRPLASLRSRSASLTWALFWFINLSLYAFVGVVVWVEWSHNNCDVGSMWWSADVVDGILVGIAVSFTSTALRMYVRVTSSLRMKPPPQTIIGHPTESQSLVTAAAADDFGGHVMSLETDASIEGIASASPASRSSSIAGSIVNAVSDTRRIVNLGALGRHGVRGGGAAVVAAVAATTGDRSRAQLRDSLAVFITIMLSSAALLLVRATLAISSRGASVDEWWWQLFVVWLPDVPPCCAYLLLMWPRDDDALLAARSHSRMGQLFTHLLGDTNTIVDVMTTGITSATGYAAPPLLSEPRHPWRSLSDAQHSDGGALKLTLEKLARDVSDSAPRVPTLAPVSVPAASLRVSVMTISCFRVLLPPPRRNVPAAYKTRIQRVATSTLSARQTVDATDSVVDHDMPSPLLRGKHQRRHTVRANGKMRLRVDIGAEKGLGHG